MANLAYQVTNFAYQADGAFAYQGSSGGVAPVVQRPGGSSNRKRRIKRPKEPQITQIANEVVIEVPRETIVPEYSLAQVIKDMEKAGFDMVEEEEDDDVLVLTFMLKRIH